MADTPSPLSLGPLSTGESYKPSGWATEGDLDPYAPAERAHKTAAEKQEALAKGFEKRRPQEEAESERAYAGTERAASTPRPAIPKMERVESPPKPEDYHKMSMTYLGAMVMLGAFGGKFIRNAANAPLAAFNGALQGWQEGNLEAYKEKSAEWKEKQQQVLDNNQARLDEYRTILEDRNASIQDQMLRVKLVAAKHQDKMMYDRADADNWTGVGQAYDQGVAVHEKAVAATDKIVEQQTQVNDTAVERANQWKAHLATPQGQQELAQLTPAQQFQIKGFVNTYADQDAPAQLPGPDTSGGVPAVEPPPGTEIPAATAPTARMPAELRSPSVEHDPKKAAFQQLRRETWAQHGREPTSDEIAAGERKMHAPRSAAGMSLAEFMEETRARTGADPTSDEIRQFQAEQAATLSGARTMGAYGVKLGQASRAVDLFADQALDASRALPRGKWVLANKAIQAFQSGTSDPRVYDLGFALFSLVNAYARAINPQGVPRIEDKKHAETLLSTATSAEALAKVIARIKLEVAAEQEATEATREEVVTGKPPKKAGAAAGDDGWGALKVK